VVRLACERPDLLGRSLSPGEGTDLARPLIAEGSVEASSAAPVRRMLAAPHLTPWRQHVGLSPKPPRDPAFSATVSELLALDTRPRRPDALVVSVDEKTSLPPRPRRSPTLPAQPQHSPTRHAHEAKRAGARHLCAAFDPRAGTVEGPCDDRQRQRDLLALRDAWNAERDEHIRMIPRVGDKVSPHHGKEVHTGCIT
jgi:hypothetical protein